MGSDAPTYVLDANVLIDYQCVDLSIFMLMSQHLGRVIVSSQVVLDEVEGLSIEDCQAQNIDCVDPTKAHLALAQEPQGALSFHDILCFALAQDEIAICVTNDRRLRHHCEVHGLDVRWGLQLMLELIEVDALQRERAKARRPERRGGAGRGVSGGRLHHLPTRKPNGATPRAAPAARWADKVSAHPRINPSIHHTRNAATSSAGV